MKIVKQFLIILTALFVGYLIGIITNIPIPANVIGMVLLFLALATKLIKPKDIKEVGDFIVGHLAVFYVVPSVGLMVYLDIFKKDFIIIFVPVLTSIIVGFFVAGKVTEILIKKELKK